jgi:hypothetical protein
MKSQRLVRCVICEFGERERERASKQARQRGREKERERERENARRDNRSTSFFFLIVHTNINDKQNAFLKFIDDKYNACFTIVKFFFVIQSAVFCFEKQLQRF